MTHDYKCHGAATEIAALNVLDGAVIGRNMQRHRRQEFTRFLNAVEAQMPARKAIHAVVDNCATPQNSEGAPMAGSHPRRAFRFTPNLGIVDSTLQAAGPNNKIVAAASVGTKFQASLH
jgi:hypothetical protein